MTTAIIGSDTLEILSEDVYKYVCNVIYPHKLDMIVTTSGYGVAETAREIGETYNIPVHVVDDERDAISLCTMAVIFRYAHDRRYLNRLCARKGKLFQEYVITPPTQ